MITLTPNKPDNRFYYFLLAICLFVLIIMCSCDCNWHLTQLKKKGCANISKDSLYIHDTIYSTSVERDTTFYFNQKDTVVIKEGKLIMKYFYNDSTVYLKGECLTDTIYYEKKVYYDKNTFNFDYVAKYKWYILLAILLIGLALFFKR